MPRRTLVLRTEYFSTLSLIVCGSNCSMERLTCSEYLMMSISYNMAGILQEQRTSSGTQPQPEISPEGNKLFASPIRSVISLLPITEGSRFPRACRQDTV